MDKNFRHFPFIDVSFESEGTKFVRFNKNTYDLKSMIMHIHQKTYVQPHDRPFKILKEDWSMQIYTLNDLKAMLADSGFRIISIYGDLLGAKFNDKTSPSIVVVARKVSSG